MLFRLCRAMNTSAAALLAHVEVALAGEGDEAEEAPSTCSRRRSGRLPTAHQQRQRRPEELLQALAVAVVEVCDGLGVLAGHVGQQALDVVAGVGALGLRAEV